MTSLVKYAAFARIAAAHTVVERGDLYGRMLFFVVILGVFRALWQAVGAFLVVIGTISEPGWFLLACLVGVVLMVGPPVAAVWPLALTAAERADGLRYLVEALVLRGALSPHTATVLASKLRKEGNLKPFANQVRALVRSRRLPEGEGRLLLRAVALAQPAR